MYIKKAITLLLSLTLISIIGCAKGVKESPKTSLPPVETIGEEPETAKEIIVESEVPESEIDIEDITANIEKKTYPGIEGEFYDIAMLKDCHFDFDKYNLTQEAMKILAENAKILKKMSNSKIQLEGHCDERGTNEYNLALGERRAASAKNYLISLGISEKNISTISYGEEMPLDSRHNEEAWAKNRRAHIVILSKD